MADQNSEIIAALGLLDPADDSQWTAEGLPVISVVARLTGRADLKRADITNAQPDFNRAKMLADSKPATDTASAEPETNSNPDALADGSNPPQSSRPDYTLPEAFAELQKQLEGAQAVLDEKRAAANIAQRAVLEAEAELDRLIMMRDAKVDPQANQRAIMEYLERQQQVKIEKHERVQQLLKAGVTPAMFQAKAPIDQAMARKTGRGGQRPIVGQKVG